MGEKKYRKKDFLGALNVYCRAKDRLAELGITDYGSKYIGKKNLDLLSELTGIPQVTKLLEYSTSYPIEKSITYRGVKFYCAFSPEVTGCQKVSETEKYVEVPARTEIQVEEEWKCPQTGKAIKVVKRRY